MKKMFFVLFFTSSILLLTNQNNRANVNLQTIDIPNKISLGQLGEFEFTLLGYPIFPHDTLQATYSLDSGDTLDSKQTSGYDHIFFYITLHEGVNNTIIAGVNRSDFDSPPPCMKHFKIIFLKYSKENWEQLIIWHILNDIACSLLIENIISQPKNMSCVWCKGEISNTCVNHLLSKSFYNFCYLTCGHWIHSSCLANLSNDPDSKCPDCSTPIGDLKYKIQTYGKQSIGIPITCINIS